MQKNWYKILVVWLFCYGTVVTPHEFVVAKKTKNKKESTAAVKEDITELLESILRQVGTNIQQAVGVQNQVMDMMRTVLEGAHSTSELKELRVKLEKQLKLLEMQQQDLILFCK